MHSSPSYIDSFLRVYQLASWANHPSLGQLRHLLLLLPLLEKMEVSTSHPSPRDVVLALDTQKRWDELRKMAQVQHGRFSKVLKRVRVIPVPENLRTPAQVASVDTLVQVDEPSQSAADEDLQMPGNRARRAERRKERDQLLRHWANPDTDILGMRLDQFANIVRVAPNNGDLLHSVEVVRDATDLRKSALLTFSGTRRQGTFLGFKGYSPAGRLTLTKHPKGFNVEDDEESDRIVLSRQEGATVLQVEILFDAGIIDATAMAIRRREQNPENALNIAAKELLAALA